MNKVTVILFFLISILGFAQKKDKALITSNNYVYEGNELVNEDFVAAEMEYRKALSEKPTNGIGAYNLGNAYYKNGKYSEALIRHEEALKMASTKKEKYKAYHNIGNALMQNKKCKDAVEAFKNALRNNPNDDETRYNLGLAKECAQKQGGGGGGEDQNKEDKEDQNQQEQQEKQDQNQDQNQKQEENEQNEDNQDQGDQEQKEGDNKEDEEGKPKDEKEDEGKGQEQKKPKRQQGKLSPQQIKNLLEAMNDQEQKVQDKMNAQKAKGIKVQNEKDW